MPEPTIASKSPISVALDAQETYAWCSCGLSATQPFCDGAHKPTEFKPKRFSVEEKTLAYLCQCKHTKNAPYCDGSHKQL